MIAANFVGNKPDDTHTLITNVTGDIGAWISSKSKDVSIDKFKPVAMLAWDEYVLMVKSDSPFNTLGDLINYSKEHPDEVTFAGTGIGTVEHMLHETLITETDAQVEYVPYEGGGEIMSALLGGHITANWANPGEAEAQIEAGTLKALAVASENRLDFLPDIPTAKEQGYDIVIRQYRGVLAPKNMPDEYLNILVNVLRKVSESDVFKEYAKNNSLTVEFKAFDDFKQEIDKVHETVINIFK
jgi:putative tricarboxylic transport membrane protein